MAYEMLLSIKMEGNIDIYNNMAISQNYYAKWKKTDRIYIHESIFYKAFKIKAYLCWQSRSGVAWGGGRWEG